MGGAADEVRRAVDDAGGRWETTVRELRDRFGLARLTVVGRSRIVRELLARDLEIEPPLGDLPLSAPVEIVDVRALSRAAARAAQGLRPAATAPHPAEPAAAGAAATERRRTSVALGAAAGLVVAVLILVAGLSSMGGRDDDAVAPALTRTSLATAAVAPATPGDDRAARYAAALELGRQGRFVAAHEAMRALIPFRHSRAASRSYAVRGAQRLLVEARASLPEDPAAARRLVARASALAPELTALDAVRAEIAAAA